MNYKRYRLSKKEAAIVILESIAISVLISKLFFDSFWGMTASPAILLIMWKKTIEQKLEERNKKVAMEFQTMLKNVSSSLLAGFSLENAFVEAEKELKQMYGEKSYMFLELQNINKKVGMNIPLEEPLEDLAERTGMEDIYNFIVQQTPLLFQQEKPPCGGKEKTDEILQNRWENKMKSLKANKKYIIFLKYL